MIAAVVGAGTMGVGIAHAFAVTGTPVTVFDSAAAGRDRAATQFAALVADGVRRGKLTAGAADVARDCFVLASSIDDIPMAADIVIESVPERVELKRAVLVALEERRPRLLGTNTSSLSIDNLGEVLKQPDRFLGFHFFNPVWAKKLIELVVGTATAAEAVGSALEVVGAIGKEAITVKDSPGFATSRLGVLLGLEAIRILESGIASAEDIDKSMTDGYAHAMGPLRLTDLVGLDVRLDIARYLESVYGERFAPPPLLEDLVAQGQLGKKTGRGFFEW